MTVFRLALPVTVAAFLSLGVACDEDTSKIGPSLTENEVQINIDTLEYDLNAIARPYDNYDARTGNLLLGNIDVPEYGRLNCSFVSRMMCATKLDIPDSLQLPERVDSCILRMYVYRGDLTGDSLAPQKVAAYGLTRQLPSDITNSFNPSGYYDRSKPLGTVSYTASLAASPDTVFTTQPSASSPQNLVIDIPFSKEFGKQVFKDYKDNPELFSWPDIFAQKYPGYFVNTTFGKGCVANIIEFRLIIYLWYNTKTSYVENGETKYKWVKSVAMVSPFVSSPEVLSSNNISYEVSDNIENMIAEGKCVITTPGGYNTRITFPAKDLIRHYEKGEHNLSLSQIHSQ